MYPRIKNLREDNDISQQKISDILSCSRRVYRNYENGERDIPTAILIKLAEYYDVSIDYILGRTDNKLMNK